MHARLGPVFERVRGVHLEEVARQRRSAAHLPGEAARMRGVESVWLERRRPADHREPAHRQRLADDTGVVERPGHGTAWPVAPHDDVALHVEGAIVTRTPADRERDSVARLADLGHLGAEAHVGAVGHERVGETTHQFVLWVDEVGPAAGDGAVVDQDRRLRRPEFTPVILGRELQDLRSDPLRLQELDGAVLDQAGFRAGQEIGVPVPLEQHEGDLVAAQDVRDGEPRRPGSDDANSRPLLVHRPRPCPIAQSSIGQRRWSNPSRPGGGTRIARL